MKMLKSILLLSLLMNFVTSASAANTSLGNVSGQVTLGQTYTIQGVFSDNYSFTVPLSSFSAFLTTLNFAPFTGVESFVAKLYSGNVTNFTGLTPIATAVVEPLSNGTRNLTIAPMTLAGGDYTLDVSGNAVGTSFSFYNGVITITPIPEPTMVGSLIAGLAMLGLIGRKRLV